MDASAGRSPKGAIEAPAAGATVNGLVVVRGYAYFDDLRVIRVDALIDGVTYPLVNYGAARADICTAALRPTPPNCPTVGFTGGIDTQGIPPLSNPR